MWLTSSNKHPAARGWPVAARVVMGLACFGVAAFSLNTAVAADDWSAGVGKYPKHEPLVGIAYTTWHRPVTWSNVWGTPQLGQYNANDIGVIRQHAEWIAGAGVDFIWIDWSNNVNYDPETMHDSRPDFAMIEDSTSLIFEEYAKLGEEGKAHPRVSIFLGAPGEPEAISDGRLQAKIDQVYEAYVADARYRPLLQDYLGKPLLVIYLGTPSPFRDGPPDFDDPRFTVRWMTGFITEQANLLSEGRESRYGFWSWEDRGPQTFAVHQGTPEVMLALASWRKQGEPGEANYIPARGREEGRTFREEWARVRAIGPRIAMVVSWNEWVRGEQPSAEVSKDIEPSVEFGHFYLDLLREQVALFKAGDSREKCPHHADVNGDMEIGLTETLRVVQLHNAGAYTCGTDTPDGFGPLR